MTTGLISGLLRRRAVLLIAPASALLLGLAAYLASRSHEDALSEPVSKPSALSGATRWETTAEGDFEQQAVERSGSRIVLRCATRGTRSDTVKFLGVRSREAVDLRPGTRIAVDLDWNNQANGSGLTAGVVLAPDVTEGNPCALAEGVWLEYVGVPPGKKARRVIGARVDSDNLYLDTEGWPDSNREGRTIGLQRLVIEIGPEGSLRFFENGELVCGAPPKTLKFTKGYLYLQMSSRSNHPPREVFFDGVRVETP